VARLILDGDVLVLRLSWLERLGSLHGNVTVTRTAVKDVEVSQRPLRDLRGARAPGTGVPHLVALGTWRGIWGKDFVAVYRRKPAVIVHLHNARYRRLVVSTDDPDALAATIRTAMS